MKTCLTDCGARATIRGLCDRCYAHHRYAGTLEAIAHPRRPRIDPDRQAGETKMGTTGYMQEWDGDRWIPQHRLVMSRHLGRALVKGETVHHKNGDRADNRLVNLELWFSPQPYGQRVEDLIAYVVEHYPAEVTAALAARPGL